MDVSGVGFSGIKAQDYVSQTGITYNYPVYIVHNPEECKKMKIEMFYLVNNADNPILDVMGHFYLFLSAFISSSTKNESAKFYYKLPHE